MGLFSFGSKKKTFHYSEGKYPRYNNSNKLVHKVVANKKYGRPARKDEEDHHKDHNPKNFRASNIIRLKKTTHRRGHREGWL
jgi:hypothetical protein